MMPPSIVGFLLAFVYLFDRINAFCPFPRNGNVALCFDMQCFTEMVRLIASNNAVILALVTYNVEKDSYSSHYLGNILDVFTFQSIPVYTVMLQIPEGMNILETGSRMIEILPPTRSIFVSYEHGFSSFGLKNLEFMKKRGFGPQVVYHMNHEKPWINDSGEKWNLDTIFNTTEQLTAAYDQHPLILRNYYYEPLVAHSHYIPVGVPFYTYLIGSERYKTAALKPASQRGTYCHFKGRLKYDVVYKPILVGHSTGDNVVHVNNTDDFHIIERQQLLTLSLEDRLGGCVAEEYDPLAGQTKEIYTDYIDKMADTAFALCPSGNNPETFRHYEALELGAIPIFLTPQDDKNFLKYEPWSTYPGPVLSNWTELESFMLTMTPQKADEMQSAVRIWYHDFKLQGNLVLEFILRDVFNMTDTFTTAPGGETVNLFDRLQTSDLSKGTEVNIMNIAGDAVGTGGEKKETVSDNQIDNATPSQPKHNPDTEIIHSLLRMVSNLQTKVLLMNEEMSVMKRSVSDIQNRLREK